MFILGQTAGRRVYYTAGQHASLAKYMTQMCKIRWSYLLFLLQRKRQKECNTKNWF